MDDFFLKCPMCYSELELNVNQEETWQWLSCDNCNRYRAEYWDLNLEKEEVFITWQDKIYKIIFDRAKHDTQIYEWQDIDITYHIITVPYIKHIPDQETLINKLKLWLTFS